VDSAVNEGALSPIKGIRKFLSSLTTCLVDDMEASCDHKFVTKKTATTKNKIFLIRMIIIINFLITTIKTEND
jgi:hypothetical protein